MNQRDEATKKKWIKEPEKLKKRLKLNDVHDWTFNLAQIKNNNTPLKKNLYLKIKVIRYHVKLLSLRFPIGSSGSSLYGRG